MDRVVNFLNANQHKVLCLFLDPAQRVRFMLTISRKTAIMFMVELGHGGVVFTADPKAIDATAGGGMDPMWSVMTAETYRYRLQPMNVQDVPKESAKWTKLLAFLNARLPSWGWDAPENARIVLFEHPYMFVSMENQGVLPFRIDDFEWSMHHKGFFLLVRLEDMYHLKHTIHERVEKIIHHMNGYIASIVTDFLEKRQPQWQLPLQRDLHESLREDMLLLSGIRGNIHKTGKQMIELYKLLHDVSLETLHVEDRMASVDHMIFQQILSFGQQKRKLYQSIDQLRLLEKHVLEFLLGLLFRYYDGYLDIMAMIVDLQGYLLESEHLIQSFVKSVRLKNEKKLLQKKQ